MLKWFNIEKSKHTTKNYVVWKDTNPDNGINQEYEMYSYKTLVIKGTLNSLEITGLYSMTTRRHIRWFVDEHGNGMDIIPFSFIKAMGRNYRGSHHANVVKMRQAIDKKEGRMKNE